MIGNDSINTFVWYEKTKEKYIREIMLLASKKQATYPYTEELSEKLIASIKTNGANHRKYKVIKNNNKEIIVLKKLAHDDPLVEVLPATQCFDIMAEIHLQRNHAKAAEMAVVLKRVVYVCQHVINIFIKACATCYRDLESEKQKVERSVPKYIAEYTVECNITPVNTKSDHGFTHVIVYIDNYTNYTLIRPTYTGSHFVFAYELLKIFLDFGLPENLLFRWGDKYTNVLKKVLESTDIFAHLPSLYNNKPAGRIAWVSRNPTGPLQLWFSNSSNWAITISDLQWQLNNSGNIIKQKSRKVPKSLIKSPYHAHFGVLPHENVVHTSETSEDTVQEILMESRNNKTTNFNGYCNYCGKDINEIYRTCVVCKKKCHFNCCIFYLHLLAFDDRRLEATCTPCMTEHRSEGNQVSLGSKSQVSQEYLSSSLK